MLSNSLLNAEVDIRSPIMIRQVPWLSFRVCQGKSSVSLSPLNLSVTHGPNSLMKSMTYCQVRQPLLLNGFVQYSCYIHAVLVRYCPERSNNMPKTCELQGANEMNSLV